MSGRCKSCDAILGDNEIVYNKKARKMEDLCLSCRGIAFAAANFHNLDETDCETMENFATALDEVGMSWVSRTKGKRIPNDD